MLTFDVRSNMREIIGLNLAFKTQHAPLAAVKALTQTAQDVKRAEIEAMHVVFDRPVWQTTKGLYIRWATLQRPQANIYFDDDAPKGVPAGRYLLPQIQGGPRRMKSHEKQLAGLMNSSFLVPGANMPRDNYGNMPASEYVRILSRLGALRDSTANASGSRRSKGKRAKLDYFIKGGIIYKREGKAITPALVAVKAPHYRARYPFDTIADKVARQRFPIHYEWHLHNAMVKAYARAA